MKKVGAVGTPSQKSGRRFWKGWWVVLVLLVAAGGAGWYLTGGSIPFLPAATAVSGQSKTETFTTPVRRGDIQLAASGSGSLTAARSMDLHFSTAGTIAELNVKAGDMVKAGDVLARLGNTESLEANLAEAELKLLEAKKALADLQKNADVALAQAYQDWLAAKTAYEEALETEQRTMLARCGQESNTRYAAALEKARKRLEGMHPEDFTSEVYTDAKNDYETALANYNYCIGYTSVEKTNASASLKVAETAALQAEAKYTTLKEASGVDPDELALAEAQTKQAEAKLAQAQEDLDGATLIAPMDGKVIYLLAGEGASVGTETFLTLIDTSRMAVDISIDETDVDKLVLGSKASIVFDVLPDLTLSGTVTQVQPQLVTSGPYRLVKGTVELDEASVEAVRNLPLGVNASVEIVSQEAKGALLLPLTALKDLGGGDYAVMVKGENGALRMTPIEIGIRDETYVEVLSGLNEGDVVSTGIIQMGSGNTGASEKQNNNDPFGGPMPGGPMPGGGPMP